MAQLITKPHEFHVVDCIKLLQKPQSASKFGELGVDLDFSFYFLSIFCYLSHVFSKLALKAGVVVFLIS